MRTSRISRPEPWTQWRRALLAPVLLVVLSCGTSPADNAAGRSTPASGYVVAVGGGGTTDAIVARTLELAGGTSARVVVLPQASALEDAGEGSVTMWQEAGAGEVALVTLDDLDQARQQVAAADLIWMPGGSQNRLMEALAGTGLPELIRQRYQEGTVVGGTSAGAAVLSQVMITGDADLETILAGRTEVSAGLGLWPEVIVDQHFLRRQRMNRLVSAVLDRPDLLGVGIDEKTAVIVHGSLFEVVGESQVVVLDARQAAVHTTAAGARQAAGPLRFHVLRDGMSFDLVEDTAR